MILKFQTKETKEALNTEALQKEKTLFKLKSNIKGDLVLPISDIDTDYRNNQKIFRSVKNICIF